VTRNNTDSSAELTNNNMLFPFYPVKEQTQPDICTPHAVCFLNLRIGYTAERIAADNFKCAVKKKLRLSKYPPSSPDQIIFPVPSSV
jgi:hypothetical protein